MLITKRDYVNASWQENLRSFTNQWRLLASDEECLHTLEFARGFINDHHLNAYVADYTRLHPMEQAADVWQVSIMMEEARYAFEVMGVDYVAFVAPENPFFNNMKAVISHLVNFAHAERKHFRVFTSREEAYNWLKAAVPSNLQMA